MHVVEVILLAITLLNGLNVLMLLYKYQQVKATALLILAGSFVFFMGFSIFVVLSTLLGNLLFHLLKLELGLLGIFTFIVYCSYIEAETLTSLKVIFALIFVSSISTLILVSDASKFHKIVIDSGLAVWGFSDFSLLFLSQLFVAYTLIIATMTFVSFLIRATKKKHKYYLVGIITSSVLSLSGYDISVLLAYSSPQNLFFNLTCHLNTNTLLIIDIFLSLFSLIMFLTIIKNSELLWAPSFSVESIYVFHKSGITILSFDFASRKIPVMY